LSEKNIVPTEKNKLKTTDYKRSEQGSGEAGATTLYRHVTLAAHVPC
jgi:hypothetical protein